MSLVVLLVIYIACIIATFIFTEYIVIAAILLYYYFKDTILGWLNSIPLINQIPSLISKIPFFKGESYSPRHFVKMETPDADSQDDPKGCQSYHNWIQQDRNLDYYRNERFENPRESCQDECLEGVWSSTHTPGAKSCCIAACAAV